MIGSAISAAQALAGLAAAYPLPAGPGCPGLPADVAKRIAGLLVEAERPLIYIGGGVREPTARKSLLGLAEHLDIPIAHSLMAKGAIPDSHPLLLGMTGFWGLELANSYAREADLVLALGTRFAETDASSWHPDYTWRFPPSKLVQIDIDPAEIGRSYPVEIGAVADTALAVAAIGDAVTTTRSAPKSRRNLRDTIRTARAGAFAAAREQGRSDTFPLRPQRILADLRDTALRQALGEARRRRRPAVLDVPMINEPVPTPGHWNITDIYRGVFDEPRSPATSSSSSSSSGG